MNTDSASAAPQATALEELHNFNADGICEAPDIVLVADLPAPVQEKDPLIQARLGSYREAIGWGKGRQPSALNDRSHELLQRAH